MRTSFGSEGGGGSGLTLKDFSLLTELFRRGTSGEYPFSCGGFFLPYNPRGAQTQYHIDGFKVGRWWEGSVPAPTGFLSTRGEVFRGVERADLNKSAESANHGDPGRVAGGADSKEVGASGGFGLFWFRTPTFANCPPIPSPARKSDRRP